MISSDYIDWDPAFLCEPVFAVVLRVVIHFWPLASQPVWERQVKQIELQVLKFAALPKTPSLKEQ